MFIIVDLKPGIGWAQLDGGKLASHLQTNGVTDAPHRRPRAGANMEIATVTQNATVHFYRENPVLCGEKRKKESSSVFYICEIGRFIYSVRAYISC